MLHVHVYVLRPRNSCIQIKIKSYTNFEVSCIVLSKTALIQDMTYFKYDSFNKKWPNPSSQLSFDISYLGIIYIQNKADPAS